MSLEIKNLSKKYDKVIYDDMSYKFEKGQVYFILGESGIGKTTLLNMISGTEIPDNGDIFINEKSINIESLSLRDDFLTKEVCLVKQDSHFFENLTLYQNLKVVYDDEVLIDSLLNDSDLLHCKYDPVKNLSGGERRRVAILRAVLIPSTILLCDEPTSSLDKETAKDVINILLSNNKNKIIIIVTHEEYIAYEYGDNILTLKNGKLVNLNNNKPSIIYEYNRDIKICKPSLISKLFINNKPIYFDIKLTILIIVFALVLFFFLVFNVVLSTSYKDFYITDHDSSTVSYFTDLSELSLNEINEITNDIDNVSSVQIPLEVNTTSSNPAWISFWDSRGINDTRYFEGYPIYPIGSDDEFAVSRNQTSMYSLTDDYTKILNKKIKIGTMPTNNNEILINIDAAYYYAYIQTSDYDVLKYDLEELFDFYQKNPLSFLASIGSLHEGTYVEFDIDNLNDMVISGIVDDSTIENNFYGEEDNVDIMNFHNNTVNGYEFKYYSNIFVFEDIYDSVLYSELSEISSISIDDIDQLNYIDLSMLNDVGVTRIVYLLDDNSSDKYEESIEAINKYFIVNNYNLGFRYDHFDIYTYTIVVDYNTVDKIQTNNLIFLIPILIVYIFIITLLSKFILKSFDEDINCYKEINYTKKNIFILLFCRFIIYSIYLFVILLPIIYISSYSIYKILVLPYDSMFVFPIRPYSINLFIIIISICLILVLNFIIYSILLYKNIYIHKQIKIEDLSNDILD